jgi:4-amino-4-deoxy-L-arabinose transferase-like glycosyltransferase
LRPPRIDRLLVTALLAGILLRIGAVLATPVFPIVANTWDSVFYHETATALAGGEGYTFQGKPTAYYPPGFSVVLSLAYAILGTTPRHGQMVNVLLSLILLGSLSGLAGSLGGGRAARATAVVLALEPSQIIMPAFLMSETLCAAALAAGLALLLARQRRPLLVLPAILLGALAGMTRGHAFLVLPAAVLALAGTDLLRSRPRAATLLTLMLLVFAGTVAGWSARNREALGHAVPIATNTGINLLLGNNPNARGGRADPPGGVPQTGNEVLDEQIARNRALDYIRSHPGRTALLLPVKLLRLGVPAPALTYRAELRRKWGEIPALVSLGLAQAFHVTAWLWLLVGWFRGRRDASRRVAPRLILFCLGAWSLGHLPFLGGARYFFPVAGLLWVGAILVTRRWSRPIPGSEASGDPSSRAGSG